MYSPQTNRGNHAINLASDSVLPPEIAAAPPATNNMELSMVRQATTHATENQHLLMSFIGPWELGCESPGGSAMI
jgi:hypothetical protein